MNYPLISEYVQSVKFSEENFDKLNFLRPVLDTDGYPIMSSGNFAVVFKMVDELNGKLYAVKCFLREQEGRDESYRLISSELEYVSSTFLTHIQYFEKELFVDTTQGNDTEFPVLLMDWVEGVTLDKYIRDNIHDTYKLSLVAYQFCRMASWLLSQEFAHGDIKPDNIMVCQDGKLVLVDYDGMFVTAMRGQRSRELGSVDYRHPLRTEDVFDGSIDDFSLASIALSLKAVSLKPELLGEFGAADRLLFCAKDYQNISESECMKAIQSLADDVELAQLLGLFYIAFARNELDSVSFKLFNIAKPEYIPVVVSTEVTDEDLANAIVDEYGAKYSRDGLRLLKVPKAVYGYSIKNGTKVIGNGAFWGCKSLCELLLPSSVTSIGDFAFNECRSLRELVLPSSVTSIGKGAFRGCRSLRELVLPSSITSIGDYAFFCCKSLYDLVIPSSVTSIGDFAFSYCKSLCNLVIPSSVTNIGNAAFYGCSSLCDLVVHSSVTSIGDFAFYDCRSLRDLVIPSSVTSIGSGAFNCCSSLQLKIKSPKFELYDGCIVIDLEKKAVLSCLDNKSNIEIPSSVTSIGGGAFRFCRSLRDLVIPSSVTSIEHSAFNCCSSLQLKIKSPKFELYDGCIVIDLEKKEVLSCLDNKSNIVIPSSVTSIGNHAFYACDSLCDLVIPSSVTSIGNSAFAYCDSLCDLVIPSSVTSIGNRAFYGCRSLRKLVLPSSVTSIGDYAFDACTYLIYSSTDEDLPF